MINPKFLPKEKTASAVVNPSIVSPDKNENPMEKLLDHGITEDLSALSLAQIMGKTFPKLYSIGIGLYWDDESKEVRKSYFHEDIYIDRSMKQKAERSAKNARKKLMREEGKWFRELYLCSLKLDTDPDNGAPAKDSLDKIRDLFKGGLSDNFLLRFLIWVIHEIASEILNSEELRKKCFTRPGAFTRERKLPLHDMFIILLTMAGDNLNNEVYEYFKLKPEQPSPQAFVARKALITEECIRYFYQRMTDVCKAISICMPVASDFSEFQSILAFDGSDINVAHNPNDEETYIDGGKNGKGWNQFHLNAAFCVRLGMFVNAIIQPKKKTHETQAAVDMIRSMAFDGPTLFLGDRGYGSLNLIETVRRTKNLDCVIRIKENWITEVADLPMKESDTWMTVHVITTQTNADKERIKQGTAKYLSGVSRFGKDKISKVWDYGSEVDVRFRVVRLHLDSGTWETIVTTLDEERYPPEKIKALYFLRWGGVENGFRVLKWDNHLAQMHSKRSEYAKQEVWARLAMHNIVSCIVNCANAVEEHMEAVGTLEIPAKEKEGKQERIINRRFATHVICDHLKNAGYIHLDVIQLLLRYKTPVRRGRSFKRDMRSIGFAQFFYR